VTVESAQAGALRTANTHTAPRLPAGGSCKHRGNPDPLRPERAPRTTTDSDTTPTPVQAENKCRRVGTRPRAAPASEGIPPDTPRGTPGPPGVPLQGVR